MQNPQLIAPVASGSTFLRRFPFALWRERLSAPAAIFAAVVAVFSKLVLTKQYTFLENPDLARQVLPWLDLQVDALRRFSWMFWNRYEVGGQSLIGQVQPAVLSPFTFLLALFPRTAGHIQSYWVHWWFVLIHFAAAMFAYALFRDLRYPKPAAVLGAIFFATAGNIGNTGWPQFLAAEIWSPLVFLFLLRTLNGRKPWRNAAWAGLALTGSWLSGHHGPASVLTLAVFGTAVFFILSRTGLRRELLGRVALMGGVWAATSAAQILPAIEYGKSALRWTLHPHAWGDRVPLPEHESFTLQPVDFLHLLVPGGTGLYADPYIGVIAVSLIAIALWRLFDRYEVRLFSVVGICALFYAMPRSNVLYEVLYGFIPLVEKTREPILALSIVHLSAAVLVAAGATAWLDARWLGETGRVSRWLLWFGGGTLALFYLASFLKPAFTSYLVEGDWRVGVVALLAILTAAVYSARDRRYATTGAAAVFLCLLLVIEQGSEVSWPWTHRDDAAHTTYLAPLSQTEDVARFLRRTPEPVRVQWNQNDGLFGLGLWHRIESLNSNGPSEPASFYHLDPWTDSTAKLYGVKYEVSKAPTRGGQREVFSGTAGYKVFENQLSFPRAWIVHAVRIMSGDHAAEDIVATGKLDLRSEAVLTRAVRTEPCGGSDGIESVTEHDSSVKVRARLGCAGLLVVSDNWFPGWHATVDGRSAEIFRADGNIRAVALSAGTHTVAMVYRPWSVYLGLFLLACGAAACVWLQLRPEADGRSAFRTSSIP